MYYGNANLTLSADCFLDSGYHDITVTYAENDPRLVEVPASESITTSLTAPESHYNRWRNYFINFSGDR